MAIQQIPVERFSLVSAKPFEQVIAAFEAGVGHPDMNHFRRSVGVAKDWPALEEFVASAVGPSGLMEFIRFDLGAYIAKDPAAGLPRIVRFVVGNPTIMKRMAVHAPDVGSYAPVTVLIDERADGVHLSYDLMASYLSPYGSLAALEVARDLDARVEALLKAAAN